MASLPLKPSSGNVVRSALADGSVCYQTDKFTEVVTWLAPDCVLATAIGYDDGACSRQVTDELERAIAKGHRLTGFVDMSRQSGQSMASRDVWTAWAKRNRPQLVCAHMLVKSRMMDMAISVFSMLIGGGIESYSSVALFEAAIRAKVPGFVHLPTYSDLPPAPRVGG